MKIDRTSPTSAAAALEKFIPSAAERESVLAAFVEVVKLAEKLGTERWSITLKRNRVRLNAGNLRVFDINQGGIKLAFDPARVDDHQKAALDAADIHREVDGYQLFPSYQTARVPASRVAELWPFLRIAALAAIDGAASWGKCPYRNAHSPGVLQYLAARTGVVVAGPTPEAASSRLGDLLRRSYASANLAFTDDQIACFFTGLQVKGFVLLTGISGTGKSKLAQHFIDAIGHAKRPGQAEDATRIRIRTMPYMMKHGHLIVPKRTAELVAIPEAGEAVDIDLHFPGGKEVVRFSHRKYSNADYLELPLRGRARVVSL